MAINDSGKWWIGSAPEDTRGFLEAYASDGYAVDDFRLCRCTCGSDSFKLEADDDEGCAKRICSKCNKEHFICDSEEYWEEADPATWSCIECRCDDANIGVGFALYPDDATAIKWLYIGYRCSCCGVLGCFAGWKIAQSDTIQLMDKV